MLPRFRPLSVGPLPQTALAVASASATLPSSIVLFAERAASTSTTTTTSLSSNSQVPTSDLWRLSTIQCWMRDFKNGDLMGLLELDRSIFGTRIRQDLMHRALRYESTWRLQGTESSKSLSMVRATTRKPFPQKGRGAARQGTLAGPHFVGGYAAHGPRPHLTSMDIPRKVYNAAMRSAISAKFAQDQLIVVDTMHMDEVSKQLLQYQLEKLKVLGRTVLMAYGNDEPETKLIRSADMFTKKPKTAYLPTGERHVLVTSARHMAVSPILQNEFLVVDKQAVEVLEELYHTD